MTEKKKVLAICGSTKKTSLNLSLINALAEITKEQIRTEIFTGTDSLPHFNPELDNDTPPQAVVDFRNQLKEADGILICTPEYAMGVPGTLKNAIDWTVSSAEFYRKPVALVTASTLGHKGHQALMETLKIIGSNITDDTQLVISAIKTKVTYDNKIIDTETYSSVTKLMSAFEALLNNDRKLNII